MDECWSQGNLNTVMELVANDCRYHDPVFPSLTSGAENIKNHIQTCRNGFPDLTFATDEPPKVPRPVIGVSVTVEPPGGGKAPSGPIVLARVPQEVRGRLAPERSLSSRLGKALQQ